MLKGLEITEIKLSEVKKVSGDLRIEAEHFQKKYFDLKKKLSRHNCVRLAELVSKPIQTGHTPSMKNERFYGGNIKFIKTDNLRDNDIKFPFSHCLSELGNSEIKRTELKENDIITTVIGATYDVIARSCIVHKEILPANINQNIAHIRPNTKKIIPEYLNMYLNSKYGKMYLEYLSRQMEQVNLNCEEVGNVLVPLFSTDFQKKIESFVKSAHTKLSESKSLYAEAEDILLSELGLKDWQPKNEAVSIKPFSDFASSGRLDAEYYQSKYDEIEAKIKAYKGGYDLIKNQFKQNVDVCDYSEKAYNYIEIGDINTGDGSASYNLVETEELPDNAKRVVYFGDILISKVRPYRGAVAIINFEAKNLIASGAFTTLHEKSDYKKEVLQVLLRTQIYKEWLLKWNVGSSYPVVKDEDVLNLPIPILPQETQEQIADCIQRSFALRAESKQLLDEAKASVEREIEAPAGEGVQRKNGPK